MDIDKLQYDQLMTGMIDNVLFMVSNISRPLCGDSFEVKPCRVTFKSIGTTDRLKDD